MPRWISSVRGNRRGANAMRRGAAAVFDPDTLAYVGRFSTPPSDTYKNALDQAIRRWKAAGVFTLIRDLWLTCADTPADSLRNLVTAARDGSVTGAGVAFSPLKGFSGFDASNYVSLPFDAAGLTYLDGQIWAGVWSSFGTPAVLMGAGEGRPGSVHRYDDDANYAGLHFGAPTHWATIAAVSSGDRTALIGAAGFTSINPMAAVTGAGSAGAFTPSPILANDASQARLTAYGILPGASVAQVRTFLSVLQTFMEDIGAMV